MRIARKVTIDTNLRTAGDMRLKWNSLTRPLWINKIALYISQQTSSTGIITIEVSKKWLLVKTLLGDNPVPFSSFIARRLLRAGVTRLEIAAGTKPEKIKAILDALADTGLEKLRPVLAGLQVEAQNPQKKPFLA